MDSLPKIDGVRLARLDELDRIALVAAAGFFHSPVFHFQRPHYDAFPEDTVASYQAEYEAAMLDPNSIVLVAEQIPDKNETNRVYKALQRLSPSKSQTSSDGKVIVGVASISLPPHSRRSGVFQPKGTSTYSTQSETLQQRDQCIKGGELYSEATAPAKAKYLTGQMRLTTLAVHPAYWKHGHGTRLTNWCTRLADLDRVPIGVSAAKMGVKVFTKAGFQEEVRVQIEGYELPDESRDSFACNEKEPANVTSIELWIGVRCPQKRRRNLSCNLWRTWNCFKAEE
ncbi:uncharacterized protein K441DRAFT_696669 [Cenococcum geophilum 1.58]|uniref:uncharacterized protein n=1 Tax=Cenococcum geophilum 1.58 TaxID=794803 RepID=UPI00358EFC2B|nr:hypothetical protein K441DRAFT_696669 [Cenococcum geophilum 1.58]